ncbi:MAG: hypothetical protein VBE63_02695 [Lamprobacter sp.]|uniref:hypothetical protein n=1 Tax=Lamprobacter sp. TaxID=3100796 RepID=UPI002B25BDA7|nr:hypothetical protein [Lamprobacter sp.]MEA3638834.1 hypothetical protein [Lamprobacter sp.]
MFAIQCRSLCWRGAAIFTIGRLVWLINGTVIVLPLYRSGMKNRLFRMTPRPLVALRA